MEKLVLGNQIVHIDAGELVSFEVNGHEFIHQKGSPGWGSADTEMFPIIGPVAEAGYTVNTPKGEAILDQHGHLRLLSYALTSKSETHLSFAKVYQAETPVRNKKYPEKSEKQYLSWPYSFEFEKHFNLNANGLEVTLKIKGDPGMPFMLGYHPAFKLRSDSPVVIAKDRIISLDEILDVGSRALQVAKCESISLKDEKEITISTEGFGHFMCWTEVPNMVCIEPITFYPYAVPQRDLHRGFQQLEGTSEFKVMLTTKI
ncbi:MAG: aldose 1-epimerase [Bacteroidota bacterium]